MYIRLTDSTLCENEYLFRLNDQQKVYSHRNDFEILKRLYFKLGSRMQENFVIIFLSLFETNNALLHAGL